jgi:hypothetical protein
MRDSTTHGAEPQIDYNTNLAVTAVCREFMFNTLLDCWPVQQASSLLLPQEHRSLCPAAQEQLVWQVTQSNTNANPDNPEHAADFDGGDTRSPSAYSSASGPLWVTGSLPVSWHRSLESGMLPLPPLSVSILVNLIWALGRSSHYNELRYAAKPPHHSPLKSCPSHVLVDSIAIDAM